MVLVLGASSLLLLDGTTAPSEDIILFSGSLR